MTKVLSVASECAPLVKTGGLADVAGALPAALAGEGVEKRTLLPGYAAVMEAWLDCGGRLEPLPRDVEFECSIDVIYDSFADLTCEPV